MTNDVSMLVSGDPDLSKLYSFPVTTTSTTGYADTTTSCYTNFCYTYPSTWYYPDKTKQAFSIAKALILKKVVKASSVQKFIELVDLVENAL